MPSMDRTIDVSLTEDTTKTPKDNGGFIDHKNFQDRQQVCIRLAYRYKHAFSWFTT